MIKRLSCLLLAGLFLPTASQASLNWISTHQSKVFSGAEALSACLLEADQVFAAFPLEAAAQADITLIDVICQPAGEKRARLGIVYEHSGVERITTLSERMESEAVCSAMLPKARESFAQAGLAPVVSYCAGAGLVVEFIKPLRVSHARYARGPRHATAADCGARVLRLMEDFRAAGFSPLLGGCQAHESFSGEGTYYSAGFHYAMPLGTRISSVNGRTAGSINECLDGFGELRRRFAEAGLPVVDSFCSGGDAGYAQVLSFADDLYGKLKTHEGPALPDMERCDRTRERVAVTLGNQGNFIVNSFCEETRPYFGGESSFRYRIHYVRPKTED